MLGEREGYQGEIKGVRDWRQNKQGTRRGGGEVEGGGGSGGGVRRRGGGLWEEVG